MLIGAVASFLKAASQPPRVTPRKPPQGARLGSEMFQNYAGSRSKMDTWPDTTSNCSTTPRAGSSGNRIGAAECISFRVGLYVITRHVKAMASAWICLPNQCRLCRSRILGVDKLIDLARVPRLL